MQQVEAVDHEYPAAVARRTVADTGVPDGVGGVKIVHSVAAARVAGEVGADAESGRKLEYARDAVVEVVGVKGIESDLCGGGMAVGEVAAQLQHLLAELPRQLEILGKRTCFHLCVLGFLHVDAYHVVDMRDYGIGRRTERKLFRGAELPAEFIGDCGAVISVYVIHAVVAYVF